MMMLTAPATPATRRSPLATGSARPTPYKAQAWIWMLPLAGAIAYALATPAEASAGRVQFVNGEVVLERAGQAALKLQRGQTVEAGDVLRTGSNGYAQVRMDDGGLLALRPASQLRIKVFEYHGNTDGQEKSVLELVRGTFRAITGLIGKVHQENYSINTPTATIGIRGTDGDIGFDPNRQITAVQTNQGSHIISSIDAAGKLQQLVTRPGQIALVLPGQAPSFSNHFPFASMGWSEHQQPAAEQEGPEAEPLGTSIEQLDLQQNLEERVQEVQDQAVFNEDDSRMTATDGQGHQLDLSDNEIIGSDGNSAPIPIPGTTPPPPPPPPPPEPVVDLLPVAPPSPPSLMGSLLAIGGPLPDSVGIIERTDSYVTPESGLSFDNSGRLTNISNSNWIDGGVARDLGIGGTTGTSQSFSQGLRLGVWNSGSATLNQGQQTVSIEAPLVWVVGQQPNWFENHRRTGVARYQIQGSAISNTWFTNSKLVGSNSGTISGSSSLNVDFSNQSAQMNAQLSFSTGVGQQGSTWNIHSGSMAMSWDGHFGAHTDDNSLFMDVSNNSGLSNPGEQYHGSIEGKLLGTDQAGVVLALKRYWNQPGLPGPLPLPGTQIEEVVTGALAFQTGNLPTVQDYRLVGFTYDQPTGVEGMMFNPVANVQMGQKNGSGPTGLLAFHGFSPEDPSQNLNRGQAPVIYSINNPNATAQLLEAGSDASLGLSWGRWGQGVIKMENKIDGSLQALSANNLHYIVTDTQSSPTTLTGKASYLYAGGTTPTDTLGQLGQINAAETVLRADFSNQSVAAQVQVNINGSTWTGRSNNMPIINNQVFRATTDPKGWAGNLQVQCTGSNCGTGVTHGEFHGLFGGNQGAGLLYRLGQSNNGVDYMLSGAAVFKKK